MAKKHTSHKVHVRRRLKVSAFEMLRRFLLDLHERYTHSLTWAIIREVYKRLSGCGKWEVVRVKVQKRNVMMKAVTGDTYGTALFKTSLL